MRRHLIWGRFGDEALDLSSAAGEVVTCLDLASAEGALIPAIGSALAELNTLCVFPSEIGIDVLVVATLVHLADTRISRATQSQDSWTREIRLEVPVSDPGGWNVASPHLVRMLNFLTGDRWSIGFRSRPSAFARLESARVSAKSGVPFDALSLFSGGLDSLIGAIDLLAAGRTPLLVSHVADGPTSEAQTACFDAIGLRYPSLPLARLRCWLRFPNNIVSGSRSESTTRGRSFLFFALGVFAGTGLGRPFTLRAPENGLIALNVPLDPLRLGSLSTRTTHPFYIARWNDMLSALGIGGRIENPYWSKTKGEMVRNCTDQVILRQLVAKSLSCSAPSKARFQGVKGRGIEHCGYCLPCLIRRAAVETAWGAGADPTTYSVPDFSAKVLNTKKAEGRQVRSFQLAVARLRARPGSEKLLIHKPGSLSDERGRLDDLASVYLRGMLEVDSILSGVSTGRL
jgi:hypothetical protein